MRQVQAAFSCCMFLLHVHVACSCCMFMLQVPLHVYAACPCCRSIIHGSFCMSILHAYAARLYCMSMRNARAACPCLRDFKSMLHIRAGHNFRCPLISPLSVDPLINGTALIFHFENVNLTEERLFLNLLMALALKILFCRIFLNLSCPL
jgi:hypothetical protein